MTPLLTIEAPSGVVFEFFVLFAVILVSLAPTAVTASFWSLDPRPSRRPTALSYGRSRRASRATASTVTSASRSMVSGTR
jgi:hypothetical protein